jgi:GNAT superfamily N-acetyltransferase
METEQYRMEKVFGQPGVVTYRQAGADDRDELVRIRLAYIAEDFGVSGSEVPASVPESLPRYFTEHLGKDIFAFVAEAEKQLVASALLIVIERPANPVFRTGRTGEVLNVYTAPEYRRKGIATQLMNMLLAFSKQAELDFVELKATTEGYPLYRKLGFEEEHRPYTAMKYIL